MSDNRTQLTTLWWTTLGRDAHTSDFVRAGGDEITALALLAEVNASFDVDITLAEFMRRSTLDGLIALVGNAPRRSGQPPPTTDFAAEAPLSASQLAWWLGRLPVFELGNVNPDHHLEIEIVGLDLDRYHHAWQQLIARHPALRTVVRGDGHPVILPKSPGFKIPIDDLRSLSADHRDERLRQIRADIRARVLDPTSSPPFEVRAALINDQRTRVYVKIDWLIADPVSVSVLGHDLDIYYRDGPPTTPGPSASAAPLTGIPASTDQTARAKRYWRTRIATLPPAPQLPLVADPESMTAPRFTRRRATLPSDSWDRLRERARSAGLTTSAVLRAAFGEALGAWCKEPEFTIIALHSDRPRAGSEPCPAVGDRTVATLTQINADPRATFHDRVRQLQQQHWVDLDHRHRDAMTVLDTLRGTTGTPTAAVLPVTHRSELGRKTDTDGWTLGRGVVTDEAAQAPRTLLLHENSERAGELLLTYDSVEDLFPPRLLDDVVAHHVNLLHRLATHPEVWTQPSVECLPDYQRAVRQHINHTAAPLSDGLLHELFWTQSRRTPDAPALFAGELTLTYHQLRASASALADQLIELGATPNALIAVVMDKGWEPPVAVLGILESGAAYVPVDPDLPQERFHYLLDHSKVRIALTQTTLADTLPWPADVHVLVIDQCLFTGTVDRLEPRRTQRQRDLAYVIYTSGSTGLPKGVMIDHRGALNTVLDINRRFAVSAEDRMLALTPLSFDLSVYDLFGPLAVGGALVMPEAGSGRAPWHWAELLEQHRVTMWNTVPALMEMLVGYTIARRQRIPDTLRLVMMSGDWIPLSLPERIRRLAHPDIDLIGLGGATEASIWSNFHRITELDPNWVSIPYGTPLSNQHLEILDIGLRRRPDWVPGELYTGGYGVAMGYWRDEEKTRCSFITHPTTGKRLYRTGDLGRYFPDGSIEFLGREDFQVKINGYRIELGEIEAALLSHDAVNTAVVTAIGEAKSEKQLVAYVTASESDPAAAPDVLIKALREFLTVKLPQYMIPAHIMMLHALPLTRNGKVDRKALPTPTNEPPTPGGVTTSELNHTTSQVLQICRSTFGATALGPDDDYIAAGATPAQLITARHRISEELAGRLPLDAMFAHRTIRQLAAALSATASDDPGTPRLPR